MGYGRLLDDMVLNWRLEWIRVAKYMLHLTLKEAKNIVEDVERLMKLYSMETYDALEATGAVGRGDFQMAIDRYLSAPKGSDSEAFWLNVMTMAATRSKEK